MTPEEKEYEELYNKGFEEGIVDLDEEPEDVEESDVEFEEEAQDLEQPEETDDIETEEEIEQEISDEDNSDEEIEDSETEAKSGRTIKWNGQEIFVEDNEIDNFLQKGFDYTKKTQDLAKYRPFIEMINENNLSPEDLATLTAAKNGNTEAIGQIVKQAGVDVFDIDEDAEYKPELQNRNYELEDVIETIQNDTTYGARIDQYIASIPEHTKQVFINNPKILQGLYEDERKGIATQVMPEVIKALAINPNADFLDTYRTVGQKIYDNNGSNTEAQGKRNVANSSAKKKASLSKKNKGIMKEHEDVWKNDELYEKMKRMTDPRFR